MKTDKPKLIYLASPYSHKNKGTRTKRFHLACKAAAYLMAMGYNVFSPIAHSHPIEKHGMKEIESGDFWLAQDFSILQHCDIMYILCLPGWEKSYGVAKELKFCKKHKIPVRYITHINLGDIQTSERFPTVYTSFKVRTLSG